MIDKTKENIKSYAQSASQKANEMTDAVVENERVQSASRKVQEAAEAVAKNEMVQAATNKVQEAADAVANNKMVQAAVQNDLVQAANRKVDEAAHAVAENEMVQSIVHNVQEKAQKLGGQKTPDDTREYKKLFEETNLVPTEKEKERGAVNLKNDPAVVIGETQPEESTEVDKAIKHMKDITKN